MESRLEHSHLQLNSNLATAIYSSDLMESHSIPAFVRWDKDTSNTPFKAGKTASQDGFAFCYGTYSGYQTVMAVTQGRPGIYLHSTLQGVASGWSKITGTEA